MSNGISFFFDERSQVSYEKTMIGSGNVRDFRENIVDLSWTKHEQIMKRAWNVQRFYEVFIKKT